jgi:hypothetical protein
MRFRSAEGAGGGQPHPHSGESGNRGRLEWTALRCQGAGKMYAIVIHANIHDRAEAQRGLEQEVIPMMKGAPGFVGAYFVALDDTHGVSIEVFETEEQAKAGAPPQGATARGVTLDTIQFGEVIGSA